MEVLSGEMPREAALCSKVLGVEVLCCEAVARLVECAKSE